MPGQNQCPFCQLIANPQQLMVVGETDNFYAWLEVNPRAKGHTMIVPKEHKENVLEFSMDEWNEAFKLTREVVEKAKKGLDADGASVTVNIEEAGGQMLPHAYIQVFPRFESDENAGTPTGAIFPQQEKLQGQLDSIQNSMANASVDLGTESHEAHPESQKFKDETEIDRILNRSDISGDKGSEHVKADKQQQEPEEDSGDPDEDVETAEAEEIEQTPDEPDMTPEKAFKYLLDRYGGAEELLESREFQQLIDRTDKRIEDEISRSERRSIDWR